MPIVEHPDVRRMLMRMKAQTQAARALVYYAAAQVDRAKLGDKAADLRLGVLTPLAKAHATDIGCEVSDLCIQIHGGTGFIEETGATQFLRERGPFRLAGENIESGVGRNGRHQPNQHRNYIIFQ